MGSQLNCRYRLPDELSKIIQGYTAMENHIGHSDCQVFHLTHWEKHALYLKAQATRTGDLTAEKDRIEWLHGKVPVPDLVYFGSDGGHQYMLTTEIQGVPSFDLSLRQNVPGLVKELARGLWAFHSLDILTCTFKWSLDDKVESVRDRFSGGQVDGEGLMNRFATTDIQRLLDDLINRFPKTEDLVVCHGDYSMPNIMVRGGRISGFIDLGQVGVADRYTDFVTVRDTFRYNGLPEDCFPLFLKEYGLHQLDESKLRFYDLLNRFLD